jgi:hypothetical protein
MFTDLSQVRSIVPLGTPSSGGEIKERHQVQLLADTDASGVTTGRNVPIISPAPARLRSIRRYRANVPPAPYADEYFGFELEVSCQVTVRFDHIRSGGDKLQAAVSSPSNTFVDPRRPTSFAAGEVIGYTDGTPPAPAGEARAFAFDYAVYNSTHENAFVNIERYRNTSTLGISLHAVCGGSYYEGALRAAFDATLGYQGRSAGGDCRSANRDVRGALVGGWFRPTAPESEGGRLAIATEVDGAVRLAINPIVSYFFSPVQQSGTVNLDPALATGTTPYCYTDRTTEVWFRLSPGGLSMANPRPTPSPGNASAPNVSAPCLVP